MKNILLIGVGGTGSNAVDIFFEKYNELGNQAGNNVTALVFDTDAGDLKRIKTAKTVVMADNASVGTICDRLGAEVLRPWFPCDVKAIRAQEMVRGASQWRKKSYLAFLNLMNKPAARNTFISALESMTLDPTASCEVYVIASVAGGTGSGSFIPIALYAKRYLRKTLGKDPIVNAMIALPDIYADAQTPENRVKVYANAYAILRELNAISLVSRNYNAGVAEHKKAPIRFRIGDPKDPNVGLLFDASDKRFWTPEAAPFSQIFLLDRIPGLNSVTAHDIVLANSLYTILCTEIGAAFDSEFSNHELLRSQNNGSNAIYAGVSTSQIRFPKESVLDYLAYKKTEVACASEWTILNDAVNAEIKRRERDAKANRRQFELKPEEYAQIILEKKNEIESGENDAFLSILERCIYTHDKKGNIITNKNVAFDFAEKLEKFIMGRIEKSKKDTICNRLLNIFNDYAQSKGKVSKEAIVGASDSLAPILRDYYKSCIEAVKTLSGSTADSVITLDKKKSDYVNKEYSIEANLLKKKDAYIHPVAAVIQLCYFRQKLSEKLTELSEVSEWEDLKKRNVKEILPDLLSADSQNETEILNAAKSGYASTLEPATRFADIVNGASQYKELVRTDAKLDAKYICEDIKSVVENIHRKTQQQLAKKVYTAIARDVDILLAKYRNFFNRFEKEKSDLIEETKTALRMNAGNVDSVINVFSTEEHKKHIYNVVLEEGGSTSSADLAETDNIVGLGVYTSVYNSAACEFAQDDSYNENDSGAFKSLFGNMVKAYRESIEKTEEYKLIAEHNVIEAMIEGANIGAEKKSKEEALASAFSVAQDLATPSLRLDPTVESDGEIVKPSNVMVFMMSIGTARYIKKHADELGLHLPADQTKEDKVIKSCAEEFIRRFSGNNSARVSIVKTMPDQVLYCTGEIMDLSPLRIAKFNELGEDNLYYRNYRAAIDNMYAYETDMWNPHLGNNLHKRGYLPYMNMDMEKECDIRVAKALLYALANGKIVYDGSYGARTSFFFRYNGSKINVPSFTNEDEREPISNKNIAMLFTWLRNEDKLVDIWSEEFDKDIEVQMQALPSLASDNEIGRLEAALTNSKFMKTITEGLYEDRSVKGTKKVKYDSKCELVDSYGPTAIEFAYLIKTAEELGRDCDDAERILTVIYDTFYKLCAYRASGDDMTDRLIKVYTQQLGKVYNALAGSKVVYATDSSCKSTFEDIVSWLNKSGTFKDVARISPVDGFGNIRLDQNFDYKENKDNNVESILNYILKGKKAAEVAEENTEEKAET